MLCHFFQSKTYFPISAKHFAHYLVWEIHLQFHYTLTPIFTTFFWNELNIQEGTLLWAIVMAWCCSFHNSWWNIGHKILKNISLKVFSIKTIIPITKFPGILHEAHHKIPQYVVEFKSWYLIHEQMFLTFSHHKIFASIFYNMIYDLSMY